MKRVLIVGADFTPSSHPPALRIRFFIQHLKEFGWDPIILTTDPRYYESEIDAENEKLLPPGLEVIRTQALPLRLTRMMGFGDIGWRTLWQHWRELVRLCRGRHLDLIFIPVPPNPTMILGRVAYAQLGIPYVIDYIDPVASDYYWKLPRSQRPPKHTVAYAVGRLTERIAIRHAAHIVGVSTGTIDTAMKRYRWLDRAAATEIPYGGEPTDFEYLRRNPRKNRIFDADDGFVHISYVGAYTPSMKPVMAALFSGIKRTRHRCPQLLTGLRLHFIGTNYQSETYQLEQVRPIAAEFGVADLVQEHSARVPYLDALNLLLESHALLAVGSVEAHYTASKIFPYILAAKPLLAIFHEHSSVVRVLTETQAGRLVTFGDLRPPGEAAEEISRDFQSLLELPKGFQSSIRWDAFEPYTTRAMACRLAKVFDKAVGGSPDFDAVRTSAMIADSSKG